MFWCIPACSCVISYTLILPFLQLRTAGSAAAMKGRHNAVKARYFREAQRDPAHRGLTAGSGVDEFLADRDQGQFRLVDDSELLFDVIQMRADRGG
jgi:hypothetical protein